MGGEIERQTVFRKEYGADAKPTGDSPGAGTVCVCVCLMRVSAEALGFLLSTI